VPILVVEDDQPLREAFELVFRVLGYKVSTAANGEQALEHIRLQRPTFMFIDLVMPVMSGNEFLEAKAIDPSIADLPVVVLSAIADTAEFAKDRRLAGALKKPVTLDQLLAVIDTVVWAREARSG